MKEAFTFADAARLLGCHVSNIPKLIRRGHLPIHRPDGRARGHLERADVEALARARRDAAETVRTVAKTPPLDRRPDADHEWLSPAQVGELLGVTTQAVHARIRRERLPAVKNGGRWWVRRDLLEQVEGARLVRKTRRP